MKSSRIQFNINIHIYSHHCNSQMWFNPFRPCVHYNGHHMSAPFF